MDKVDSNGCEEGVSATFVFRSRPNQSLTRGEQRVVFWTLAMVCLGTASGFALLGYWPILPFAGLEIGLLAWAHEVLRTREGAYETITIEGDKVVLEWQAGTRADRREMNRRWARVTCECASPGRNCHLRLSSHGRDTEVGQYLSDEARLRLAATLRRKLRE